MAERALDVQKDIFACFVDDEKAFDKVRHEKLFGILKDLEVDGRDLRLIKNLYWRQKAGVRVGEEISMWQDIRRGVRQGCVLSPDLFNIYSEVIMRDLVELEGIRVGGGNVNNIRYADDTVLLADSAEKLESLVGALVRASDRYGLKLNTTKTKIMVVTKGSDMVRVNVRVGEEVLEQVEKYKYLGSLVTQDGRCVEDIKTRIAIAKNAFTKIKAMVTNRAISINLRKRFIKAYVWSTLTYGCEAWTINKEMERRIEAMEMWCYRRMLKIAWTERVSNEQVLIRAGAKREMMRMIRQRQLRFLGHVMRRQQLESNCMTGRLDGRRGRGRPRMKFLDSLAKAVGRGTRPVELLQMTSRREDWRSMVANVLGDTAPR